MRARSFFRGAGAVVVLLGCTALGLSCERVTYYALGEKKVEQAAGTSGGVSPEVAAVRAKLLSSQAVCAGKLYAEFQGAADELSANAQALAAQPSGTNEEAARASWKKAIGVWQKAELILVGPAAPAGSPGGKSQREYVYSWPLVGRCLVEQNVVSKAYGSPDFLATALVNTRGLAALEYLLFYTASDNACSASATINSSGSWAALSALELADRKADYASVLALDVAARAEQLAQEWSAGGGNFEGALSSAKSPFTNEQHALNALSDGLFYIDHHAKDLKLGKPLGLVDCTEATCLSAVESQYAKVAADHVRNNLIGFQRMMSGCGDNTVGFDALLAAVGAGDVAVRMKEHHAAAMVAADALVSPDLIALLQSDRPSVETLHARLRDLTTLLKTEFVTVLDLEIPKVVEGDND